MDLCDYKQIQTLLQAEGFHFSKAKGQNFLVAGWVPVQIAESCGLDETFGVTEIGTGVGCLTEQLASRAGKVLSFEVDEALRPVLARTLAPYDNIEVVFGDVMRQDLAAELAQSLAGYRHALCANLPYSITSPVLTKIYESGCFEFAVVMVQKEVADRICATPGQKDYGAFTLLTRWYAEPELLFRLIRAAFNMRRKTLVNALDSVCGKDKAGIALAACGFPDTVRGETLSLEDFVNLTNTLDIIEEERL